MNIEFLKSFEFLNSRFSSSNHSHWWHMQMVPKEWGFPEEQAKSWNLPI